MGCIYVKPNMGCISITVIDRHLVIKNGAKLLTIPKFIFKFNTFMGFKTDIFFSYFKKSDFSPVFSGHLGFYKNCPKCNFRQPG